MSRSALLKKGKSMAVKAAENAVKDVMNGEKKSKSKGESKKKDDPVEDIIKLTAATIGIVSEIVHHKKEKKRAKKEEEEASATLQPQPSTMERDDSRTSNPDPVNQHDELPSQPPLHHSISEIDKDKPKSKRDKKERKPDPTSAFLSRLPSPPSPHFFQPLSDPIIVPQRRPNTRARGFLRAYPPILSTRGISQATFLDFIDTLNTVLVPNPWLYAINLVGEAGNAVPEPVTMIAIGVGVGLVAEGCVEANSRMKGSEFMEKTNREFWGPRGLVCSVVKWGADAEVADMDSKANEVRGADEQSPHEGITATMRKIAKNPGSYKDEAKRMQEHLQSSLTSSDGTVSTQKFAPLIFPDPAEEAQSIGIMNETSKSEKTTKKANAFKRADKWMDEYMDKHAQGRWAHEHENRTIAEMIPKPEFRSRYADPSHPASSGDALALITGGKWSMSGREEMQENEEGTGDGEDGKEAKAGDEAKPNQKKLKDGAKILKQEESKAKARRKKAEHERLKSKSVSGTVGDLLKNDMLYLMIVDKPMVETSQNAPVNLHFEG